MGLNQDQPHLKSWQHVGGRFRSAVLLRRTILPVFGHDCVDNELSESVESSVDSPHTTEQFNHKCDLQAHPRMSTGTIRWGILSTAKIGVTAFIPSARVTPGAELVAVASRSQDKADTFALEHELPVALGSYQVLLDREDIDAVYISLPNSLHAKWTIRAAEAGKHVFCEKPLAVTAADGHRMLEACRTAGVLLFEAFVFLHHPQSRRISEILRDGGIGALRHINAGMGYVMRDRTNIRMNKDLGGGSIYDGGVYPITYSRFVAGNDPVSVQAVMRFDEEAGVDLRTALLREYPGGATATLYCGFDGGDGQHARIVGGNGVLQLPSPYHPPAESSFQLISGRAPNRKRRTETIETGVPPFQPAIHFFQRCILGEETPAYMADHAIGTLKVVEAAFESARTRQKVLL